MPAYVGLPADAVTDDPSAQASAPPVAAPAPVAAAPAPTTYVGLPADAVMPTPGSPGSPQNPMLVTNAPEKSVAQEMDEAQGSWTPEMVTKAIASKLPSRKDVADVARPILQYGGAALGGIIGGGAGIAEGAGTPASIALGAAQGVAGAGLGYAAGARAADMIEGKDQTIPESAVQSAKDVGTGAAMDMGGQVAGKVVGAALGKLGATSNPELAALSTQHDVPLTAGMESQSVGMQNLETQLERVPFVGTRGAMQEGSNKIGAAAQRLVGNFTPENATDVPDQIQESMLKTLKQGKSDVGNIQNQLSEAVKAQDVTPIEPTNLKEAADTLLTEFPDIFDRLPSTPLKSKLTAISQGADPGGIISSAGEKPITRKAQLPFDQAMLLREQLNDYISRAYNSAGAVGSKETYQLTALKRALDEDITRWGENSDNADVVNLFKQRNQVYQDKVAPFKDVIVKKATGNTFDTDLLYNQFIKSDRPQLAQKLMDALDPEGQQLVKYSVLKKALEAGQDTKPGIPFSPAKFAGVIEKLGATKNVVFPGEEGTLVTGFTKLARAAERYGQYAENPPTGLRATDTGISVGIGGGLVTHPFITGGALGVTKIMSKMLTSEWGKAILLRAAKLPDTSPAMVPLLKNMF